MPYGACQQETTEKRRYKARLKNLNNLADRGLPILQIRFFGAIISIAGLTNR